MLDVPFVVPAAALFVAAAADVAAAAATLLVAEVDVIAGMPTTCCNDCSKLPNSPCVEVAVELPAVELEFVLDVLVDVIASACKPFLCPRVWCESSDDACETIAFESTDIMIPQ